MEEINYEFGSDAVANESKQQLAEFVWPEIERNGGRVIGLGTSALANNNTFTTFISYPSFREYVEYGRAPHMNSESSVHEAWQSIRKSSQSMNRRLLIVGSDYGTNS